MINKNKMKEIPVVFSVDDNYIPYLCVAIKSLIENASKDYFYRIYVFHNGVSLSNQNIIRRMNNDYVKIQFLNVKQKMGSLSNELHLRDYYSESIYFRLFIPSIFPNYEKVFYLDSDIVVTGDISKLYNINIKNNLVAAVTDAVVSVDQDVLKRYVAKYVGVEPQNYFNSGVLLINVREFLREQIEKKFIYLLNKFNFNTVAPDQDYLNALCKGKVYYLDAGWNFMMMNPQEVEERNIIHYNMFLKPWLYKGVPYEQYFWEYAEKTPFYNKLKESVFNYSEDKKKLDQEATNSMILAAESYLTNENSFKSVLALNQL